MKLGKLGSSISSLLLAAPLGLAALQAHAYPYPPAWDAGEVIEGTSPTSIDPILHGGPIHFAPAPWPAEPSNPAECGVQCGDWKPYTRFLTGVNDPRVQDPSNGGTSPQNYVNIASSCIDKNLPSIYYHLLKGAAEDGSEDVIMFRWRVEQIANTYATGPSPGNFSTTDPWNSALWTVLFDLDGDGFRDLSAHLDGSSGSPSTAIDRVAGIWGNIPTQSVDYQNDPSIKLIAHNPTAFIGGNNKILNFLGYPENPTEIWPNGSAERTWDYGTTRSKLVYTNSCTEYFIDYQIPARMLDASSGGPNPSLNGPKITRDTPISMLFCTANSLNNPFQKDCALNASYVGDVAKPAPFGDYLSFNKETPYAQPIVTSVTATAPSTCPGNYSLTAKIQDTLYVNQSGSVEPSIKSVKFYYWFDRNGDGKTTGDTGSVWTYAVDGVLKPGTLNTWTASWDANTLLKGRYLVGVQALDDGAKHDNDVPDVPVDHRTFSYLPGSDYPATQAQIYTNDWSWDGLAKIWVPGSDIGWIQGQEPTVFPGHYPAIAPGPTEDWYGNPDVTGVQTALIGVALNVCGVSPELVKSANVTETTAGGDVQYTLQVVNKTAGTLSLNSITDTLPDGFSYVSTQGPSDSPASSLCTSSCPDPTTGGGNSYTWVFSPTAATVPGGCSSLDYSDCTRTLVYNTMASATVGTYNNVASMLTDFGSVASNPVQVGVGEPRLTISKTPTDGATPPNPKYSAAQGDSITYLVTYANDSPVIATGVTLIDVIPEGLTYGSCTGGCTHSGGTLTWNIGDLIPGEGPYSVSYTATIANPYPDTAAVPNVNTATIDGDNTTPADATASVFVQVPRPKLVIQKTADKTLVDPAGTSPADQVTYTLSYRNAGDATATNAVITDVVPAGFTFVSATNQIGTNCTTTPAICSYNTTTRVVTWNLANLASEASGSVTLTLQVSNPYTGTANPAANTATLDADNAAPVEDDAYVGVRESAEVCSDFYFRADTGDVGSAGTQKLATTLPVPVAGDTGGSTLLTAPAGSTGTWSPALSFYQYPASSKIVGLSGNLSTRMYINRTPGAGIIVRTTVYDYNSATGGRTQLGQGETTFNGSSTGLLTFSVPFAAGAVLAKDHRMLWTYEIKSSVNNSTADILFQYDGTVANTQTDGSTSTFADSSARFCVLPPANLALDKRVDQSYVSATGAGRTLTYTIDYANTGATAASVAKITDTLPSAGILSATCAITGSTHFTGCTVSGSQVTFHNGSGGGVSIPAGASGSVTITATLADNLTITELTNTATISSNETSDLSAAATTLVGRDDPQGSADLVISKAASATLLQPGDSVTYTLTALNAGTKTATNIVVSDNFPEAAWFTYEGTCTATVGTCTPAGTPTGSLSWAIDSLAPGATATLSFTLKVGTAATTLPPDGVTTRDNLATGNYQGCATAPCSATSNTVTVSVTTNPYLAIEKSVSPSGVVAPGGILTYTLLVSNTGSGSANDVLVRDPIPANTSFIAGSTTQSQGSASFDAVNNQVIFDVGSIDGDGSATLTFKVKLNSPLPAGDSTLTNLATVSASNALSRTDNAVSTAQAKPVLTLEKSGPASAPYPAARLTAAANGSTTLFVNGTATFEVGQYIRVGSTIARITELAGSAMIVDAAITAAANADVIGAVTYSMTYRNTGDADASVVVITDTLPAGLPGLTYVTSSPNANIAPAIGASGDVVWNLGTLPAGASGAVQVTALPTGAGTVTNAASIDSAETDPVLDSIPTSFGGLRITKRTTTPIAAAPGEATYVIEVSNSLATSVAGVTLTDTLTPGFSYQSTGTIVATGATRTSTSNPTVGTQQPTWGTWTLPANGSLTLTFTANVTDSVGPGTYQNEASVATTTPGIGITPFDPLATTAEDVTILPPGSGVVQGIVYEDNDKDGSFDPLKDTPLGGVSVTIVASDGTVYVAITDSAGLYRQVVPAGDTVVDVQNGTVPPDLVLTISDDGIDPDTVTVPSGGSASKDVGYVPSSGDLASITGNVWNDADDNQALNGTEAGMIGVQVILRDINGNVVATEYTDALGNYAFPNIPPGNYRVDVVPPTGYLVTTGNDPAPVSVAAGDTGTANFGLLQGAILSGTVFNDLDASGLQNGGETGLDPGNLNVVVLDASGKVLAVVPVGNDGTWSALVKTGSGYQAYYTLQTPTLGSTVTPLAQLPAGWLVTGENISGTVQAPANGILTGIDVSADRPGLNFGIRAGGGLGDYVWYDTNHDGIQDPDEPGIAGVTVELYGSDGTTLLDSTQTDGSGAYSFDDLLPGTYSVAFVKPDGYEFTQRDATGGLPSLKDSFDSDANPVDGKVTIVVAGDDPTIDAGLYLVNDDKPARIGNRVWFDTNKNGVQEDGEPGIAGVTVKLFASDGTTLIATTLTDGQGRYEFTGLPAGDYLVEVVSPAGYSFSPGDVGGNDAIDSDIVAVDAGIGRTAVFSLAAGDNFAIIDAGLYLTDNAQPATISDRVWYDTVMDGLQDAGEPGIPGVRVNLYDDQGGLIATAQTDANGNYAFTGLTAGDYQVEFELPVGYDGFSPRNLGTGANDSDPDPMTGIAFVSLDAGQVLTQVDAGMFISGLDPIVLGDYVWLDADDDLAPNDSEWLDGVEVVLYNPLGIELARVTTSKDFFAPQLLQANYLFTGVAQGDYRVAIDTSTLPAGATQIADPDDTCPNVGCNHETELLDQTADNLVVDFGYAQPDFALVKTATPQTYAAAGDVIDYTFVVTNNGGVRITGPITIDDDQATDEACPDLMDVGNNDAYLDKDESVTCAASYTITAADVTAGSVTNIASASGFDPDGNPVTTPTDTETVTLDAADLKIEKSVSDTTPEVGDTVTYSLTLTSLGPNGATGVQVVDSLPNGLATIDAITPSGTYDDDAGTITWSGLSVAVGTPVTLSYAAVVQAPGDGVSYANTAEVTASDQYDSDPSNNEDDATLTPRQADLEVTKVQIEAPEVGQTVANAVEIDPSTITAGTRIYYLLTVVNNGPDSAINARVSDTLPAGISDVEFSRNFGNSWNPWTGTLTYEDFTADAPASTDYIVIRGTVAENQTADLVNTASVDSETHDPDSGNNDDELTTTVTAQADLALTKAELISPVQADGAIEYRITVTNLGPSDASGVVIADAIDSNITGPQYSINETDWAAWTGSYTVGSLAKDAEFVLLIKGIVVTSPSGTSIPNTASVSSTSTDPVDSNNTEAINTPLGESVDIGIVKTGIPTTVTAGEKVVYTLVVTNHNAADSFAAKQVHIVDTPNSALFEDIEYSDTGADDSWSAWTSPHSVGDLDAASSITLYLRVTVKSDVTATSVTNTASVETDTPDTNESNDSASAETSVTRGADLKIEKKLVTAPEDVVAGGLVEYELVYTNLGPSDATNVVVTDAVPTAITNPEAAYCNTTSYSAWTGSRNVGTVVAGGVCRIFIRGTLAAGTEGSLSNTAQVATVDVPDPNTTNNQDQKDITVLNPSIALTKVGTLNDDDDTTGVSAGDTVSYTFSVTNTGNAILTAITLSDPKLPDLACDPIASLAPAATQAVTCTEGASHPLTQADIDTGSFTNSATATGKDPGDREVTDADDDTQTLTQSRALTIVKSAEPTTYDAVGVIINYQFLVTNTGNVTIDNLRVEDDKIAEVSCPATTLAPGANTPCTASYEITRADLNAGEVVNTAKALGQDPDDETVESPTDDATVTADQKPALSLQKSATPTTYSAVGEVIDYELLVTNTGNVSLDEILIADDQTIDESCPALTTVGNKDAFLDQGESVTCTASYTITADDLIAGSVTNEATASGKGPDDQTVTSPEDSATVSAKLATLYGHLYLDTDGNGKQDTGEPDLANIDVLITPAVGAPFRVTTDANGDWTAEVPAGETTVDVDERDPDYPVEHVQTEGEDPSTVTAVAGEETNAGTDGYTPLLTIGDRVWHDTDQDGIQDPDEPGIAGVTVNLTGTDAQGGLVDLTTQTDGSGAYVFENLKGGEYTLTFTAPAGYSFTIADQGAGDLADSFDSDVVAVTVQDGETAAFALNGNDLTIDAGLKLTSGDAPARIGDRIWYDGGSATPVNDGNGIQDEGEPGLAGVRVNLYQDADQDGTPYGPALATTVSDGSGDYEFAGLPAGGYVVEFVAPAGYSRSPQGDGSDNVYDSDADASTGRTGTIELAAGEDLDSVDAGFYVTGADPAAIGDRVWYDGGSTTPANDGNGIQDPGEPGLPGVVVKLYDVAGTTLIATTVTDAEGGYAFTGLAAGSYQVVFERPAGGYVFSEQDAGDPNNDATDSDADPVTGGVSVTLAAGETKDDIDAGLRVPAQDPITVGDFVFLDLNGDGQPDAGEGLDKVVVVLYDALGRELARASTTDDDANYLFSGIAAGLNYRVAVDAPTLPEAATQVYDPDGLSPLDNMTDLLAKATGQNVDIADFGYVVYALKLEKSADPSSFTAEGDQITYTLKVTNTGTLALTNVEVMDPLAGLSAIDCGGNPNPHVIASLAPAVEVMCTATYTITAEDVGRMYVGNTATATAPDQGPGGADLGSSDDVTVNYAAIALNKTLYGAHNAGEDCDNPDNPDVAKDTLIVVTPDQDDQTVTWCFKVTNTGNQLLGSPVLEDDPLEFDPEQITLPIQVGNPVPVDATSPNPRTIVLKSGNFPLVPGQSAVWYMEETRNTGLLNSASISLKPTDAEGGETGDPAATATDDSANFAYVFDPPFGIKTGEQLEGQPIVRWRMEWINDATIPLDGVIITDPIPEGMTFRGNLSCNAKGDTSVVAPVEANCTYQPAPNGGPRGQVYVVADFAADPGRDENDAEHPLIISFDVTVNPPYRDSYLNEGKAEWTYDRDGAGPEDPVTTQTPTESDLPGGGTPVDFDPPPPTPPTPPTPIPTLSEWAMLLLSLMLMGIVWRSRSRFGVNR